METVSAGAADVIIRVGGDAPIVERFTENGRFISGTADSAVFSWEGLGTYLVERGRKISVIPEAGADPETLRLPLLGIVLGMLLSQRGLTVVHSSAVAVEGKAVLFVGHSGSGKSTTAGALHRRGHELLADDWSAIHWGADHVPRVLPAFPRLKLWPDAAEALGNDAGALPRLAPHIEKRGLATRGGFSQVALPLRCIYSLGRGETPSVHPLRAQEAILDLTRHSLLALVGRDLFPSGGADELRRIGALLRRVPAYRLVRPWALDGLDATADFVLRHVRSLAGPA